MKVSIPANITTKCLFMFSLFRCMADKRQHTTADKNNPPANEDMKTDSKQLNIHAVKVDSNITINEHK